LCSKKELLIIMTKLERQRGTKKLKF